MRTPSRRVLFSSALGCAVVLCGALRLAAVAAQNGAAAPAVTFAKDVAPILQEKCQVCHQPNSIGPMPLISYDDAKSYARAIKNKVSARLMPPWHIDKTIGIREFQNDRSLSDAQIDTIVRWVDAGAPPGNPDEIGDLTLAFNHMLAQIQTQDTALRASEARKTTIMESALDCIITADHEGRIIEFNPAAEKTFGYTRAEVAGRTLAETIIPPAHREQHEAGMANYLATGQARVFGRRRPAAA